MWWAIGALVYILLLVLTLLFFAGARALDGPDTPDRPDWLFPEDSAKDAAAEPENSSGAPLLLHRSK